MEGWKALWSAFHRHELQENEKKLDRATEILKQLLRESLKEENR